MIEEVFVDLGDSLPIESAEATTESAGQTGASLVRGKRTSGVTNSGGTTTLETAERPSEGTTVVVAGGQGMSRPLEGIHAGFGSTDVDGTPSAESKRAETLSERGTRTLRDALYARDTALGLGADGPILQALASVAQASTAPVDGRAVFDVVVGGDGIVTSVSVSEGGLAWSGVARDALDAVRGKKARVPGGAKGVAIKIELKSNNLLPSGHSPKTQLSVGGIPLTKGDDKAIKVSVLNPIPKIVLVPMDAEGKVTLPMAYVEIFGTNVDPTDIDAHPRRVIAAKVLDEHLL